MSYERQYYTNGDVLDARQMNHMEKGIKENSDNIDKLSEDIATKANAIKEKASGEVLVVTDSDEAKPLELAIDGKSEQNQYSGKNLLKNTAVDKTINGLSIKVNEEKRFSVNGTSTMLSAYDVGEFTVKTGEIYILTGCPSGGSTSSYRLDVRKDANSGLYNNNIVDYGSGCSFTATEDITLKVFMRYDANYTFNNIVFEPMIRLASVTDSTYEPYCGEKPSPSPEYKQEIRNIGVYDEASGKYAVEVKCTGKNLIPFPYYDGTGDKRGVVWTINADGIINANGTATGGTSFFNIIKNNSEFAKYGKVVCSLKSNASGIYMRALSGSTTIGSTLDNGEYEIDLTSVTDFNLYLSANSGVTINNATIKVMIRPVGTNDTYEPYKETTATVYLDEPLSGVPVSSGGNYTDINGQQWICDYVDFERGKLVQNVKKVDIKSLTLNYNVSSKAWITSDISNTLLKVTSNSDVVSALSDCFVVVSTETGYGSEQYCIFSNIGGALYIRNGSETEKPTGLLYYALATPIETDLSEDVINTYKALSMFYPTTILSNDCNAIMEVTYIADTKAYVDKKITEVITAML